jgi:toxin ParE1/3/4
MPLRACPYRLAPAAIGDLEAIADYLNQRDPVAAVRFVEAAQATFEQLGFAPLAFPRLRTSNPRLAGLRWRPLTGAFRRYLVFYAESDEHVDIIRVLHSAREIERVLLDED